MRRRLLFPVLLLLAVAPLAHAQTPSPLDGPVQWRGPGPEPVIELPIEDWTVPNLFIAICRFSHVPCGLEQSPTFLPAAPRPNPADAPTYIRFGGMTLREAFDTLVKLDPRYLWRDDDGVAVMRPVKAWADPHHFLNRSIGTVAFKKTCPEEMGQRLIAWMFNEEPRPFDGISRSGDYFPLEVREGTILMALDATLRADGDLYWRIQYPGTVDFLRGQPSPVFRFDLDFLDRQYGGGGGMRWTLPPPWDGVTAGGGGERR